MPHDSEKPKEGFHWGTPASILIHAAIAAVLLINIPARQPTPEQEQAVNVELVPPPEEKKPEAIKPEEAKKEEKKPEEPKPQEKPPEPPKPEAKKEEPPPPPPPKEEAKEEPKPEAPKEVAKEQPKPEQPKPEPPKQEKPKEEKPKEEAEKLPQKSDLPTMEPVFGFDDQDTGPKLSDKGNAADTETKPAVTPAPSQTEPLQPVGKPASASPVPKDINLPRIDTATSHPENDAPTTVGTDEAKTSFEPEKSPDVAQSLQGDTASKQTPGERPPEDKLNRAKTLLSQKAGSGTRASTSIGNRERDMRVGPLCVTELAVQLQQAGYSTDGMPSYGPIAASVVIVSDGKFQSGSVWYGLKFRCEVNAAATKVLSVNFSVGKPIPQSEWKRLHLTGG
jgi:hypothetical protein